MRDYTDMQITEIVSKHNAWRLGKGGERADLSGTDLSGTDLRGAIGNMKELKSLFITQYAIVYTSKFLQIGCERHEIAEWWAFDDGRILEMDGERALQFWRTWKMIIKQIIEISPAVPTGHVDANKGD